MGISSTCCFRDRRNYAEQKIATGRKSESWEGWIKPHCPWDVSCWSDAAAWARGQEGDSGFKGSSVLLWWGTEAVILVAHTSLQIPTTSALGTASQGPRGFFNIQIFCRMFTSTPGAQSSFCESQQQTRGEGNLEAEGHCRDPQCLHLLAAKL